MTLATTGPLGTKAMVSAATLPVPTNVTYATSSESGGQITSPEGHGMPQGRIVGEIAILLIG